MKRVVRQVALPSGRYVHKDDLVAYLRAAAAEEREVAGLSSWADGVDDVADALTLGLSAPLGAGARS